MDCSWLLCILHLYEAVQIFVPGVLCTVVMGDNAVRAGGFISVCLSDCSDGTAVGGERFDNERTRLALAVIDSYLRIQADGIGA